MINFWEFINNWVPLPISLIAAYYSLNNYLESKPKIEIQQIDTANSSVLIEPDRLKEDLEYPDRMWHKKFRVISDLVIINKSSKPITIIEMKLNDELVYNSYSKPGDEYKVTIANHKTILSSGSTAYGNTGKSAVYPIQDKWLNFLIDIEPNSAVRGYIFFSFNDLEKVNLGKNKLEIITSRKKFKIELLITEAFYSQLLPQEKFDLDKYQNIL